MPLSIVMIHLLEPKHVSQNIVCIINVHSPSCSTLKKDCSRHVCKHPFCETERYQSSPYCSRHGCTFPSCANKSPCLLHSCTTSYCNGFKINGSQFCKEHKCYNSSCQNLDTNCRIHHCQLCRTRVDIDNSHCKQHKCPYDPNCNNGYETCVDHVCLEKFCTGRRLIDSEYCIRHKCQYDNCFLEINCPLHTCQVSHCYRYKLHGERYCVNHKCAICPTLRSRCREHLCVKCNAPITNIQSNVCQNCTCTSYGCREAKVFKSWCRFHAPRCIECPEMATYFSIDVQEYLFCRKHKCCKICTHKPRSSYKTICGRHHIREQMYPWLYPSTKSNMRYRRCLADMTILGKAYYQSCERTAIIKNRILNIEVNRTGDELSDTLQYVLTIPTEIFVELESYIF